MDGGFDAAIDAANDANAPPFAAGAMMFTTNRTRVFVGGSPAGVSTNHRDRSVGAMTGLRPWSGAMPPYEQA